VIVPVGANGMVSFYNAHGNVDILADISGWFATGTTAGGGLAPVTSTRLLDTRSGVGAAGPVGAGQTVSLAVLGRGGVPTSGVGAVILNVTATQPSASSWLAVYPGGQPRPATSNVNFLPGRTAACLVIVPVGPDGTVQLFNSAGQVQILADVVGWFGAVGAGGPVARGFDAVSSTRVLDTRSDLGATGPVGPGQTLPLAVLGHAGVPASGVEAAVGTVTATQPTASSWLAVWPGGQPRPGISNLNFLPGQTGANLAIPSVGAAGTVNLFNSAGDVQILTDISGWFAEPPP